MSKASKPISKPAYACEELRKAVGMATPMPSQE
jgi:hypothetical protein